jgi:hypothetical protein
MHRVHKSLHLQHHRHTGRVLHRKHTSYRGLAVVLVLATAFMIGLNMMARATADTLTVYARNPAPIPTEPAIITSPEDNALVTRTQLVVSGICPDITPHVIIAILDNGVQAGSVPCDSDNKFSVVIEIGLGHHTLVARVYTITGDAGLDSEPVHVTHISVAGAVSTEQEPGLTTGLTLTIDEPFIVFGPAKDAIWSGSITGGTLPYHVHIDWGDGKSSNYTLTKDGHQDFAHHYRSMQPHIITLKATDSGGRGAVQRYAAVTPYIAPPLITVPRNPWNGSIPLGVYGIYLILLAIVGRMWQLSHQRPFAYAKVPVHRPVAVAKRRKPRNTR